MNSQAEEQWRHQSRRLDESNRLRIEGWMPCPFGLRKVLRRCLPTYCLNETGPLMLLLDGVHALASGDAVDLWVRWPEEGIPFEVASEEIARRVGTDRFAECSLNELRRVVRHLLRYPDPLRGRAAMERLR